jgi:hypothetical protein
MVTRVKCRYCWCVHVLVRQRSLRRYHARDWPGACCGFQTCNPLLYWHSRVAGSAASFGSSAACDYTRHLCFREISTLLGMLKAIVGTGTFLVTLNKNCSVAHSTSITAHSTSHNVSTFSSSSTNHERAAGSILVSIFCSFHAYLTV